MTDTFAGDKKVGSSLLSKPERLFVDWAVPKLPQWITSRGLTMMTVLWSAGIIMTGYLASTESFGFLWIISACIFYNGSRTLLTDRSASTKTPAG